MAVIQGFQKISLISILLIFPLLINAKNLQLPEADHNEVFQQSELSTANSGLPATYEEGDLLYDSKLALQSLKNGQCDVALFAFERLLIMNPDNPKALLGMAICYYRLKFYSNAKEMLEKLEKLQSNNNIKKIAERYLEAIAIINRKAKTRVVTYAEINAGYDSNSNASTQVGAVFLPEDPPIFLPPTARAAPSNFTNQLGGVTFMHRLNESYALFGNVSAFNRINTDKIAAFNNFSILNGTTGIGRYAGDWRLFVPLNVQLFYLNGQIFRRLLNAGVEIGRNVKSHYVSVLLNSQFLKYFPDSDRDSHFFELVGNGVYRPLNYPVEIATHLIAAQGQAIDPIFEDLIRGYYGVNVIAKWTNILHHTPYISVFYQYSKFNSEHFLFLKERSDNLRNIVIGWDWHINKHFTVTPSASYSLNKSNINIFSFEKYIAQIGLKYQMSN